MEIKLELNKDVNYNANYYFQKAKKLKAKLPGIEKAINITKDEILNFDNRREEYLKNKDKRNKIQAIKSKEWYEKFRWTILESGHLFVLGKDSGTNEVLIKKHATEKDIIFHTESSGSPFGIVKDCIDDKNEVILSKDELIKAGQFLCCFSSQWKKGFGTADAFWVRLNQVSKKANSGEYMSKGSFMIRGDKNQIKNIPLRISFGVITKSIEIGDSDNPETIDYDEVFSGTQSACVKFCNKRFVNIEPGQLRYKAMNKILKTRLKCHIEELPKYLPQDCKILKK